MEQGKRIEYYIPKINGTRTMVELNDKTYNLETCVKDILVEYGITDEEFIEEYEKIVKSKGIVLGLMLALYNGILELSAEYEMVEENWFELHGRYYGYPDCCIKAFDRSMVTGNRPLSINHENREVYLGSGYIPCLKCSKEMKTKEDMIAKIGRNPFDEIISLSDAIILRKPGITEIFKDLGINLDYYSQYLVSEHFIGVVQNMVYNDITPATVEVFDRITEGVSKGLAVHLNNK